MRRAVYVAIFFFLAGAADRPASLRAQSASGTVQWSASFPAERIHAGAAGVALLTLQVQKGWHVYAPTQLPGGPTAMTVQLPGGQPFQSSGAIRGSIPNKLQDSSFGMETQTYEGSAEIHVPFKVDPAAPPGTAQAHIDVRFQTCSATECIPPRTVHLQAQVSIVH